MQPGAFAKGQISINSVPSRPFSCVFFAFFSPLSFKHPYLVWAAIFRASEACIRQILETGVVGSLQRGITHHFGTLARRSHVSLVGPRFYV